MKHELNNVRLAGHRAIEIIRETCVRDHDGATTKPADEHCTSRTITLSRRANIPSGKDGTGLSMFYVPLDEQQTYLKIEENISLSN